MQRTAQLGNALASDFTTVATNHDCRAHVTRRTTGFTREVQLCAMQAWTPHLAQLGEAHAFEHERQQITEAAVRQVLQGTGERAAQDLSVALRGLQQITFQTRQLPIELPFGETDAIGGNAEAGAMTTRQRTDVVRTHSSQEQPLRRRLVTDQPTATLSRFTQGGAGHGATAAIEAEQ